MVNKKIRVPVVISIQDEVATSIAYAELEAVYSSSGAEMKIRTLEEAGITSTTLAQYFKDCAILQAAFCEDKRNHSAESQLKKLGFRFSELKQLYLPTISATILSQMGDVEVGGYRIEVCATAEVTVDRTQVIKMSEALYRHQYILFSEKDQIGVANREADVSMMCTIVSTVDTNERVFRVNVFTGCTPDQRASAIGAMMGVTLRDAALNVLYPFEDIIEFSRPGSFLSTSSPD